MEREEFKVLVKGMKAVYVQPTFIPDADAFDVWYSLLKDISYNVLSVTIQKYMMTNKFPPTIADLRELATEAVVGREKDWSEAWDQVQMAIRKYGMYRVEAAVNSLDDITNEAIRYIGGFLKICQSENPGIERANFRDTYNTLIKRKKEEDKLSLPVREALAGMIGAGNETRRIEGS